ncbi:LADA_0H17480g1_1 [Lachancea dasiensis]|uniref:LADA_0H17480g1_1 n=1 Tax=Lachancea dasiensis TaxID=1072105 RepID=A0A1G4K5K4_9SACH|nr:LADA_0H17480g1_1 [Lachancea dasiensis]
MEHVPAWKRIAIKKRESESAEDNAALNVTTHLATANLSKQEKRRIIRGETGTNKSKKANPNKRQKKDKAPREERLLHKEEVLKDQLRYLIDFYREKVGQLPREIWDHKPVRIQLGGSDEDPAKDEPNPDSESKAEVTEVWKFSKQKQNWLLKHVLDDTQIPSYYDELVYAYFKDLKGGSKLALVSSCRECIDKNEKFQLTSQNTNDSEVQPDESSSEQQHSPKESENAAEPSTEEPSTEDNQKTKQLKEVDGEEKPESEVPPSGHQVERAQRLLALLE